MVYNRTCYPNRTYYRKSGETEGSKNEKYPKQERYAVEARIFNTGMVITKVRPAGGMEGTGVLEGKLHCRCVDVFDSKEEAEEFCRQYRSHEKGKRSMITREIEERSTFFEGKPLKGWELVGMRENRKNRISYYRDKQGHYHHTAVPLKRKYNPFEIHLREKDGVTFARVELKKQKKGCVNK